jgi:CRP/FNR family transcriptional regulator
MRITLKYDIQTVIGMKYPNKQELTHGVLYEIEKDAQTFCTSCAFSSACVAAGYDKRELAELHCLIEHTGPFEAGDHVFRAGETFRSIYAVRSGMVKTMNMGIEGREHVLGFYLPGEVVGLDAIYPERYPCDAIALEKTEFCRFSFPAMSDLAARVPIVLQHLLRMLSKELGMASHLAGDHTADERIAAFLVDLGERYMRLGIRDWSFRLGMSRADIANHLRLASETVSRVLGRFRAQGLVHIEGRDVRLLDPARMRELASPVLDP